MRSPLLVLPAALAVAALTAAVALPGCGGDDDSAVAGDQPAGSSRVLVGRTFLSTAVTEDGAPRPLVDGTQVRLDFNDDGRLVANAGCNTMGGDVEITDDRLVIGEMGMTAMGCEAALEDQEEWLSGVLFDDPAYTLDGAQLRIESGTTVIELTDSDVAEPDQPLEGTEWQLDSLVDGDAVSSVPAGTGATVVFDRGGVNFQIDGCNSGGGPAGAEDGTIVFGDLVSTLIGCPSAAADVEAAVTGVLTGEITYAVDGDTLTLTHPSGQGLVLRAAS